MHTIIRKSTIRWKIWVIFVIAWFSLGLLFIMLSLRWALAMISYYFHFTTNAMWWCVIGMANVKTQSAIKSFPLLILVFLRGREIFNYLVQHQNIKKKLIFTRKTKTKSKTEFRKKWRQFHSKHKYWAIINHKW